MFKTFSRLALITTVLAVSACAVIQPKTDEERVFALAEKRQAALMEHDFKKAYQYMSPGYRQLNNLQKFQGDYAGVYHWESSEVLRANCEEDVCNLDVKIFFDIGPVLGAAKSADGKSIIYRVSSETWVKLDNKWWFSKSE